jgi:hypothetical protein
MHSAILLDPFAERTEDQIKIIEIEDGLDPLHSALSYPETSVTNVEAVTLPTGDTLWVDGEGLFASPEGWLVIKNAHQPFAGRGVITGIDNEGASCAPRSTTLDWCKENISFARTLPGDVPK